MKIFTSKAISSLEYTILIVICVAVFFTAQTYFKRGAQGRLKDMTDDIGTQFSPGETEVKTITRRASASSETFINGVTKSTLQPINRNRLVDAPSEFTQKIDSRTGDISTVENEELFTTSEEFYGIINNPSNP